MHDKWIDEWSGFFPVYREPISRLSLFKRSSVSLYHGSLPNNNLSRFFTPWDPSEAHPPHVQPPKFRLTIQLPSNPPFQSQHIQENPNRVSFFHRRQRSHNGSGDSLQPTNWCDSSQLDSASHRQRREGAKAGCAETHAHTHTPMSGEQLRTWCLAAFDVQCGGGYMTLNCWTGAILMFYSDAKIEASKTVFAVERNVRKARKSSNGLLVEWSDCHYMSHKSWR